MRRSMVLASFQDGDIAVLDFTVSPPTVLKTYRDHRCPVLDFAYEDSNKLLISTDQDRSMIGRLLSNDNQ